MREYVSAVYGWEDGVQRKMFDEGFDPSRIRIIRVDDREVGLLEVEEKEDHFFLGRIELLPDRQKKGIGTHVIRSILEDADRKNRTVLLQVLRPNPARALYERLGFSVYGETATHFKMKKSPNQAGQRNAFATSISTIAPQVGRG
jgi:ribosomal protein S18 acetylase RimI-like enzyme